MARFGRPRCLTCFYCGTRSTLADDGTHRDFLCAHCDATNYLDEVSPSLVPRPLRAGWRPAYGRRRLPPWLPPPPVSCVSAHGEENGEITDPPVATELEAPTTHYAAPRPSAPTDSIFCPTCLKNQHLFTKSLAQYLPDDPSDPEFVRLERNYYRYRRGLEKRYPQVCDACAVEVDRRIRRAGYTAKTDHLRRMMELSRGPRRPARTRARTTLDWVSNLAAAVWTAGFALQMLWHLAAAERVLHRSRGGTRPVDETLAVALLHRVAAALPRADSLMSWSITAALTSAWWNPHIVQVNRGFTRHLLGFTQWYSFQGLVLFFRLVFRRILTMDGGHGQSAGAQLCAHAVMAAVMALVGHPPLRHAAPRADAQHQIYRLATRSIRVDTSPLFATGHAPTLKGRPRSRTTESAAEERQNDSKTLSDLLDDALGSANGTPQTRPPRSRSPPVLDRLGIDDTPTRPRQAPTQYPVEMDWSPITPQHRAFVDHPSPTTGTGPFEQSAVQDAPSSPFWYKVPAAPLNPAQRLRNPPRAQEAARQRTVDADPPVFKRQRGHVRKKTEEAGAGVEFRQPKFFAPESDDASSLADLLSQSFHLNPDDEEEEADDMKVRNRGASRTMPTETAACPRTTSRGGLFLRLGLLLAWLPTMLIRIPHQLAWQTAILVVAGIVALDANADASADIPLERAPGAAAYLNSALGVAELAVVCWVASELWKGEATELVGRCGLGVLATMLAHRAARGVVLIQA
ncbi:hypothetical protein DCS_08162 [Drechmeria coniospora]|uniref:Ima1 N-terminal domain-containing protein n=1 Tax=Drechmeria coniospora TaxID=98403 RepID=A0A151GGI1_DRECN|nr:hypothetical protein DCS_08162 [Drechmeria coniospora]KYK56194.1 hypothetical protein DCS_08162 [Drechmeria coniospora]